MNPLLELRKQAEENRRRGRKVISVDFVLKKFAEHKTMQHQTHGKPPRGA